MGERKKIIITIIATLAGLFFLITRFCLPVVADNANRRAEYRQLKLEVETIEEFDVDKLNSLESQIDMAISGLEEKFPPKGKLNLVGHLTKVPVDASIVFTEITHRNPKEMQDYQAFPVDVSMKASFYDLIKYLAGIETSPLMIGIKSLSLRGVGPEAKSLDVKADFLGFRLTHKFPSASKYLEEKYKPLNKQRLEKLLEPVKIRDSKMAVLRWKDYHPFLPLVKEEKIAYPEPETIGTDTLSLKGILHIGDEKAALINDTIVREGEEIAGMKIVEIKDYKVIFMRSGKKYILKMGIDDELIKP